MPRNTAWNTLPACATAVIRAWHGDPHGVAIGVAHGRRVDNGAMPRITAPTVAEHRVAQRRALLDAGVAVVTEAGVAAATPRTVAERAGLARSTFYEYFPSRDDLLAAIALQAFDDWAAEIDEALSGVEPGRARLHAYIAATLRMAADGKHDLATQLQEAELSPTSFDVIMQLHERITAPLRELLAGLGVADADRFAALVQGLIDAGLGLVAHGASPDDVAGSIGTVVDAGVHP